MFNSVKAIIPGITKGDINDKKSKKGIQYCSFMLELPLKQQAREYDRPVQASAIAFGEQYKKIISLYRQDMRIVLYGDMHFCKYKESHRLEIIVRDIVSCYEDSDNKDLEKLEEEFDVFS